MHEEGHYTAGGRSFALPDDIGIPGTTGEMSISGNCNPALMPFNPAFYQAMCGDVNPSVFANDLGQVGPGSGNDPLAFSAPAFGDNSDSTDDPSTEPNNDTPIGTPKTSSQCSVYQDGSATGNALSKICQAFPNGPVSNQIRGCLQSCITLGLGTCPYLSLFCCRRGASSISARLFLV